LHIKDLENGHYVYICDGCLQYTKSYADGPTLPPSSKECEFFEAGGNLWVRWKGKNIIYAEKVGRSVDDIMDWWRNLIAKDYGVKTQNEYDALIDQLFKD
jgi:hypothetical protein